MKRFALRFASALCVMPLLALFAVAAGPTPTPSPRLNTANNPGSLPNTPGMTPQQAAEAQRIWQLRAMQARGGSSGPQRGVPQIIGPGPFANPQPTLMPPAKTSTRKSAAEKRAEVKVLAEQRKQALRDEADRKKQEKAQAEAKK